MMLVNDTYSNKQQAYPILSFGIEAIQYAHVGERMARQSSNQQLCLLSSVALPLLKDLGRPDLFFLAYHTKTSYDYLPRSFLSYPLAQYNSKVGEHLVPRSAMDKKTPSKSTKSTEDITSPELPITIYPLKRADSPTHDRREIQETPARPKGEVSTTSSAVQHRSQRRYQETDIDDGEIADNEHPRKGDPSLHRSFGKTMKLSDHYEKLKRAGKINCELENTVRIPEHDSDDVVINDWDYSTGVLESAKGKGEEQKDREKTPEDKELPEEVPETPQPARKKQKMDDE